MFNPMFIQFVGYLFVFLLARIFLGKNKLSHVLYCAVIAYITSFAVVDLYENYVDKMQKENAYHQPQKEIK